MEQSIYKTTIMCLTKIVLFDKITGTGDYNTNYMRNQMQTFKNRPFLRDLYLCYLTRIFFCQMHTLINLPIPATAQIENV